MPDSLEIQFHEQMLNVYQNALTKANPRGSFQNRPLVADQPATAAGQDERPPDQVRSVLLAVAGGGPSDTAAVWGHPAADRTASAPGGIAGASDAAKLGEPRGRGRTGV